MENKINLARLNELIEGKTPSNRAEELFILMYKLGIGDSMVIEGLFQISDVFEDLEKNEVNHFVLGYALGQKTLREAEQDLVLNKPKSFH